MLRHALFGSCAQLRSMFEASVLAFEVSVQLTIEETEIRFVAVRRTLPSRLRAREPLDRDNRVATCIRV